MVFCVYRLVFTWRAPVSEFALLFGAAGAFALFGAGAAFEPAAAGLFFSFLSARALGHLSYK